MSNATAGASSPSGAVKVSPISEVVIRIAGNSQDGIQAIGGFLARLAGRSEQEVMTFMTIPSTISGGPSIFQVRIGSGEVLTSGDDADVLLAFYQHSYEGHINSLKKKRNLPDLSNVNVIIIGAAAKTDQQFVIIKDFWSRIVNECKAKLVSYGHSFTDVNLLK